MTRKVYRTAQGKLVDLGALQLQNENVRAVGNMGVNARGDLLDSENRAIGRRNKQVSRQYDRQVATTSQPASSLKKQAVEPRVDIPAPPEDFEDDFIKPAEKSVAGSVAENPVAEKPAPEKTTGTGGLASAIAKARQIKQSPLTPIRKTTNQGIKKI